MFLPSAFFQKTRTMKNKSIIIIAALVAIVGTFAATRFFGRSAESQPATARRNASTGTMHSDAMVQKAHLYIERMPNNIDGYNLLASAFLQKARETGDFQFNARAAAAIENAEKLESNNIDTLVLKGRLLLAEHRFSEVIEVAKQAQTVRPDHPDTFGLFADAFVELGKYDEAVAAAQKLMICGLILEPTPEPLTFVRLWRNRKRHERDGYRYQSR